MLYAYFDFDAYFFKIFAIHIFWANLILLRHKIRNSVIVDATMVFLKTIILC